MIISKYANGGGSGGGVTTGQVQTMIDTAINTETGRTEETYQKVLTAGEGITIEDGIISATGGGGGNYLIVDSLDEIENPYEGLLAYVRGSASAITYNGFRVYNLPATYLPEDPEAVEVLLEFTDQSTYPDYDTKFLNYSLADEEEALARFGNEYYELSDEWNEEETGQGTVYKYRRWGLNGIEVVFPSDHYWSYTPYWEDLESGHISAVTYDISGSSSDGTMYQYKSGEWTEFGGGSASGSEVRYYEYTDISQGRVQASDVYNFMRTGGTVIITNQGNGELFKCIGFDYDYEAYQFRGKIVQSGNNLVANRVILYSDYINANQETIYETGQSSGLKCIDGGEQYSLSFLKTLDANVGDVIKFELDEEYSPLTDSSETITVTATNSEGTATMVMHPFSSAHTDMFVGVIEENVDADVWNNEDGSTTFTYSGASGQTNFYLRGTFSWWDQRRWLSTDAGDSWYHLWCNPASEEYGSVYYVITDFNPEHPEACRISSTWEFADKFIPHTFQVLNGDRWFDLDSGKVVRYSDFENPEPEG